MSAILLEIGLWGGIAIAIASHSWLALLLVPSCAVAALALHSAGAELHATDATTVARARTRFVVGVAVMGVVAAGAYLVFGAK